MTSLDTPAQDTPSSQLVIQTILGVWFLVILIGLAWTILPPAMASAWWIWSWAAVFSLSAAFAGCFFENQTKNLTIDVVVHELGAGFGDHCGA